MRRIRDGLLVDVLTMTIVLQLLLHCEPSVAIVVFVAKRSINVELASEPSNSSIIEAGEGTERPSVSAFVQFKILLCAVE